MRKKILVRREQGAKRVNLIPPKTRLTTTRICYFANAWAVSGTCISAIVER
jgi:hypothetical protein